MTIRFIKYCIFLLLGAGILNSCSDDSTSLAEKKENENQVRVAAFSAEEEGENAIESPFINLLDDAFIDDYSIIYISQKNNTLEPVFESGSDNMYTYQYYNNPEAWWGPEGEQGENQGGYNFAPVGNDELDWDRIKDNGREGNAYVFCSLYFPGNNTIKFNVNQDQSSLQSFRNSNVLGAKHTTANEKSRLRFRFYHLMVYLQVSLYVPVWDAADNSGFLEGGLKKGVALDIINDFLIEWGAQTGADSSPNTYASTEGEKKDIIMYLHPDSEETEINISDFYGAEEKKDKVRKYTFSVLFPAGEAQEFTGRDFLRFTLNTPGGTEKNYLFSTAQMTNGSQLQFQRGHVSLLELYLPRHENNTILVNAEILEWGKTYSDLNVVEDTNK